MNMIGIDEVGRGALAGPVCIGIFQSTKDNLQKIMKDAPCAITDSKKVTEKRRNMLDLYFKKCQKEKLCTFFIVSMDAEKVDRYGISVCLKQMIKKGLETYFPDCSLCEILLDGGLVAPDSYKQKTIIKGDFSEPIISCASLVAKVYRDTFMKKQSDTYPMYGFEKHVGYGTSLHINQIKQYGLSDLHRKTFCTNIQI